MICLGFHSYLNGLMKKDTVKLYLETRHFYSHHLGFYSNGEYVVRLEKTNTLADIFI